MFWQGFTGNSCPIRPLNFAGRLFLIEIGRDHLARVLARHHRHDLEGHAELAIVGEDPFLQQPQIVAFHELEATVEIRLDPAADVFEAVRKLDAGLAHAPVDRDRIAILETLDHHEKHAGSPLYNGEPKACWHNRHHALGLWHDLPRKRYAFVARENRFTLFRITPRSRFAQEHVICGIRHAAARTLVVARALQ